MPTGLPSLPTSSNSKLNGEEKTLFARLAPALQGTSNRPAVQALLSEAQARGVDVKKA